MNDYCDIFISYRRKGGLQMAESLYEWLTVKKGYSVFFDKKSLREGRWDKELRRQVRLCKDFLLIVDKHLFDRMFDSTYPKEEDWVRQELSEVINRGDDVVNIIPIILPKAVLPKVLPDDIGTINKWNWISIENKYDLLNKCEELKNRLHSRQTHLPDFYSKHPEMNVKPNIDDVKQILNELIQKNICFDINVSVDGYTISTK
ncbi:MAG: toll/interleukin-1 receptor domain-containing protein [Bacteroidaceae bacterium]|nr:toll/interleukin-1 receptor domain-containing protein [Bacteroidaceae bacterium]